MKKFTAYFMAVIMLFCTTGVSALTYEPPYETPAVSDRIWEEMPEPFSLDGLTKAEVAACDFNDAASSDALSAYHGTGYWSQADGAVAIHKTQTDEAASFVLKYAPATGLTTGEFYAFSCRIKTVGVQNAAPKNILSCYNSANKWLSEAGNYGSMEDVAGDHDWYEMIQFIEAAEGASALHLSAYLPADLTGTVYFDDFKLYKLALDPLDSVLRSPNYKGLIYGDGDGDIVLDAMILENKGIHDLENMMLSIQLLDENDQIIYNSEAEILTGRMTFVFSSRGLSEGDYYLQSILKNKTTEEIISTKEHTLRKRTASYRPDSYVDENGHFVRDNEKTFLKRIYNYRISGDDTHYLESAQFAKETGIDTISNYGMWWAAEEQYKTAFDYMRQNGISSHIAFNAYYFSGRNGNEAELLIKEQTDIPGLFSEVANDYKDDSVLEGYYLFDEPNPHLVGEEIRWNNQIMAELDIDHPTFGVADKAFDEYGIYTKMADIIGVDPYPVTGTADDDGNPTYDISEVGDAVRQIKQSFPNRPVYCVLQGFHNVSRGDLRSPNHAELKNMAWQAICEGAEGLDWYAYPEMTIDDTKTIDQWTSEVKTILSEIKNYEAVILSDEPAPKYTVSANNDWLNLTLRRYKGRTYLFAANHTYDTQHAAVSIEGMEPMSLSFEPLEVKQLSFEQAAYLSPEAELLSMGFSNGTQVFAVSEGEENILYAPAGSGVINYTANISEDATLYIDGKEMPLTGKITVRNCDSFTVTVLASDGKTKTTKYYQVIK